MLGPLCLSTGLCCSPAQQRQILNFDKAI